MKTAKEILEEELSIVEGYISFLDAQRSRNGILFIPDELIQANDEISDTSFEEELIEAMMTPIDPDFNSAFMGCIIRGPGEMADKIRPIGFDTEFRKILCARAYDIKGRIDLLDKGK